MSKRKNYCCQVEQLIGFLPCFRKRNMRLPLALCVLLLGLVLAPQAVWAGEFKASSANESTVEHMYQKDGAFGTDERSGQAFETAPDGTRVFKTPQREKKEEPETRLDIIVQPEVKPVPPKPKPPVIVTPK